jgi:hypothetical protein
MDYHFLHHLFLQILLLLDYLFGLHLHNLHELGTVTGPEDWTYLKNLLHLLLHLN